MRQSMTGYASAEGAYGSYRWTWEMRGVNGKGLDLRFRLPDTVSVMEPRLKAAAQNVLSRGNVQINLRLQEEETGATLALNRTHLRALLAAMAEVEQVAMDAGLSLAPSTAADIVAQRGVMEAAPRAADTEALTEALIADFENVLAAFTRMRAAEGAHLQTVLAGQLDRIAALTEEAAQVADARRDAQAARLATALARVMENAAEVDPTRVAQELALIAVKADVTEEIDRLGAHVAAARAMLDSDAPIGRKLDFLMQEFNREANTLCSKAGSAELTQVGLTLKTTIDQMREQVQNVE